MTIWYLLIDYFEEFETIIYNSAVCDCNKTIKFSSVRDLRTKEMHWSGNLWAEKSSPAKHLKRLWSGSAGKNWGSPSQLVMCIWSLCMNIPIWLSSWSCFMPELLREVLKSWNTMTFDGSLRRKFPTTISALLTKRFWRRLA